MILKDKIALVTGSTHNIGLAIAREVANGHGGKIEVISRHNRGATFRLTLPLAKVASTAEEVLSSVA